MNKPDKLTIAKLKIGIAHHKMLLNDDGTPADFIFLEVNPAFEKLIGHSNDELIGKTASQVIRKGSINWIDFYSDVALRGKEKFLEYFSHTMQTWFQIYAHSPEKLYFITEFYDISERKAAEEALIAAKQKAEESELLKSAFLANMSHEIRTPMNGILGFLSLLEQHDLPEDEKSEYLQIIRKSSYRLMSTINDIINISKIESGQMTCLLSELSVNKLLSEIHSFFKPEADEKSLSFSCSSFLSTSDNFIKSDPYKINAIITNLVKNALKFTFKGSVDFGCERFDNSLRFFVRDTGIGISQDKINHIFDRFFQADNSVHSRSFEGSGLGLAISKAYSDMLGGSIQVESKQNSGTSFFFTLPIL